MHLVETIVLHNTKYITEPTKLFTSIYIFLARWGGISWFSWPGGDVYQHNHTSHFQFVRNYFLDLWCELSPGSKDTPFLFFVSFLGVTHSQGETHFSFWFFRQLHKKHIHTDPKRGKNPIFSSSTKSLNSLPSFHHHQIPCIIIIFITIYTKPTNHFISFVEEPSLLGWFGALELCGVLEKKIYHPPSSIVFCIYLGCKLITLFILSLYFVKHLMTMCLCMRFCVLFDLVIMIYE